MLMRLFVVLIAVDFADDLNAAAAGDGYECVIMAIAAAVCVCLCGCVLLASAQCLIALPWPKCMVHTENIF